MRCISAHPQSAPDVVLVSMVGTDCVTFNRAFASAGLARHMLRLSVASEENTLFGIGARHSENFYFTAGYLAVLDTPANQAFLDRYHAAFGREAPMPNTIGQSCSTKAFVSMRNSRVAPARSAWPSFHAHRRGSAIRAAAAG